MKSITNVNGTVNDKDSLRLQSPAVLLVGTVNKQDSLRLQTRPAGLLRHQLVSGPLLTPPLLSYGIP